MGFNPYTKYIEIMVEGKEWFGTYNRELDIYERHMVDLDGNIIVFETRERQDVEEIPLKREISKKAYWSFILNEDLFERKIKEFERKLNESVGRLEAAKEE